MGATVLVGGFRERAPRLNVDEYPRVYRIVDLSFRHFSAAATTVNYDITGFPGGILLLGAHIVVRQNFTGGGAATATLSVGTTASAIAYVAAADAFAGTVPRTFVGVTQVPGIYLAGAAPIAPTAAGTVRVQGVFSVNGNLLTAGLADVFLLLAATSARP